VSAWLSGFEAVPVHVDSDSESPWSVGFMTRRERRIGRGRQPRTAAAARQQPTRLAPTSAELIRGRGACIHRHQFARGVVTVRRIQLRLAGSSLRAAVGAVIGADPLLAKSAEIRAHP